MYRPEEMSAQAIEMMNSLDLPSFEDHPFVPPKPLDQRRVAIISSAGLHRRGDRPFGWAARDYRTIPIQERALVMSHVSVDFDRTGFEQDLNTIFPIERLEELADAGVIGSVAKTHYSFMGGTDPLEMEPYARKVVGNLREDEVDTLLLVPI